MDQEVGQKVADLRQNMMSDHQKMQGLLDDRLQTHRREVQLSLDEVRASQPEVHLVQRLRMDCEALAAVVSETQGAVDGLATSLPTRGEVQASLDLLEARLQVGIFKEVKEGDKATGSQATQIFEKLMKAQDEKFSARLKAVEKVWEVERKDLGKRMESQDKKIELLEKTNEALERKIESQKMMIEGQDRRIESQQKLIWTLQQDLGILKTKISEQVFLTKDFVTMEQVQKELKEMEHVVPPPPPAPTFVFGTTHPAESPPSG